MAEENLKEEIIQTTENFPEKKKKPWLMITLIVLLVISMGTVSVLAYQNYLLKNQIQPKKDISATAEILPTPYPTEKETDSEYKFSWNETNKTAFVLKNGNEIVSFSLTNEPLDVLFYTPKNILAITAEDENSIQHLFIYKDKELTKVYSGRKITYSENLKNHPTILEGITFSRDGNYFIFNESGWEIVWPHLFSLIDLKDIEVDDKIGAFASTYWHPQNLCFIQINTSGGMLGSRFKLLQLVENELTELKEMKKFEENQFEQSQFEGDQDLYDSNHKKIIWWDKDCSGIVGFVSSKDNTKIDYYKFGINLNQLELTNENATNSLLLNQESYEKRLYPNN